MKQKLIIFTTLILILVLGIWFLQKDEEHAYEVAKAECESEVVIRYTNSGDSYYVCK